MYESLKPLMVLDPLLLCGFIFICPRCELPKLFHEVDPFISTSFMITQMEKNRALTLEQVSLIASSIS